MIQTIMLRLKNSNNKWKKKIRDKERKGCRRRERVGERAFDGKLSKSRRIFPSEIPACTALKLH